MPWTAYPSIWGTDILWEPYQESPGGQRQVIYFDKARMEINDPDADPPSSWYVTNGLLVVELITGQRQFGDDLFVDYGPAEVNVAGDPDGTTGPTYAALQGVLDGPMQPLGSTLDQWIDREGTVTIDSTLAPQQVVIGHVDDVTGHGIAAPFWEFMTSAGLVYEDEDLFDDVLFDPPIYATGRPITGAYWTTVQVAGESREVLVQCFERRCLTYTPGNPDGFVVEAGNVGQHYYTWRYIQQPD